MKPRFALSTRILLLAGGNLLLLGLLFFTFARFMLHMEFDSLLFGARDRVVSLARQFTLDLEATPPAVRDDLLRRYKETYQVDFYLFGQPPVQIAGPAIAPPSPVMNEIRRPPAQREDPPPPPRRDGPEPAPPPGRGTEKGPPLFSVSTSAPSAYWVGARIPIRAPGNEDEDPGVLLMKAPSFFGTPLFFDYKPWVGVASAIAIVFVLCWLPFIRGITRAVTQMSRVTEQIAEGHFDHHLPEDRGDELGVLAAGINRMASRLSGFVYGQKRFLGDIAHELCAPIARIQFALGVLEHRTEPGTVDDLQEEVRQMSSLVAELLSFSKAGMQPGERPLVAVALPALLRDAVAREGVEVAVSAEEGLTAMADPELLGRAVANLIRNAKRYAGHAGPVTVAARRENGQVSIIVADQGPGLPEEELDRVFTPFYRVETSRNRASGGVGLGLAIVKNCIDACRGSVRCRNRAPSGLEVEIRLSAA